MVFDLLNGVPHPFLVQAWVSIDWTARNFDLIGFKGKDPKHTHYKMEPPNVISICHVAVARFVSIWHTHARVGRRHSKVCLLGRVWESGRKNWPIKKKMFLFLCDFGELLGIASRRFSEKSSKKVLAQHLLPEMNLQYFLFEMDFWSSVIGGFLWDLSWGFLGTLSFKWWFTTIFSQSFTQKPDLPQETREQTPQEP